MAGGLVGGIASRLPGTDASKFDDMVLATAQAVGTILEGGKLAAGDEVKYRKMLPSAGDGAARRKAKIRNVKKLLDDARQAKIKAFGQAGYNTGGFAAPPSRVPAAQALPTDASGQPTLESPASGGPSRPDKKLDLSKTESRRTYSKDGKWMKVYYTDGTYGLAPAETR
jgi:hypothetical protein